MNVAMRRLQRCLSISAIWRLIVTISLAIVTSGVCSAESKDLAPRARILLLISMADNFFSNLSFSSVHTPSAVIAAVAPIEQVMQ